MPLFKLQSVSIFAPPPGDGSNQTVSFVDASLQRGCNGHSRNRVNPPCVLSCLGTVTKFSNSASTEALFVPRRKWHRLRDPSHAEPRFDRLSRRLRETLACLLEGEGDSEKHVASRLGLSQATIHQYVTALYRHFNVGSRAQLLVTIMRRTGRDRREQLPPSREVNRRPGPQAPLDR